MRPFALAFIATILALCPLTVHAQTFLIDHSSNVISPIPTFGGTWNSTPGTTIPTTATAFPLVTSTGAVSPVTLTYNGVFGTFGGQTAWSFGDFNWVANVATADLFGSGTGTTTSITFGGLIPGQAYQLDHLAARAGAGPNRSADYTVNGLFADTTPNGDNFEANVMGFVAGNILTWNAILADANGQITMTATPINSTNFGYYTASRLTVVPEPTLTALGLLAIVAALPLRRLRLPAHS